MSELSYLPDWPQVRSSFPRDPAVEERVSQILGQMSVAEKIGQMLQPELVHVTPQEVRDYGIGSAFNGAGIWPDGDRRASVAQWVQTIDAYWMAGEEAWRDRPFRIPFMWATDAVHGHNNVFGATIFPHNIGLGAARDPDLVRRIGETTAREIAATGMSWTFAPTVATPRDRRWGRYYEGYSEDPEIVHRYAGEMVLGLQGTPEQLRRGGRVIASLKHWVADGATVDGADRGTARCSEDAVRNIHATGFFSGIEAGAQSVMLSFTSWENPANYDHTPGRATPYNFKVHGSRYLVTDVLKDRIGFDGIVAGDWDAHAEISGASIDDASYAINAGIDVLMVAERAAWQPVFHNAVAQVASGEIAMSRIDDAVSRILRVKMRAGLWELPRPGERVRDADMAVVGCAEHRALSREAVRKSLVLLKNARGALPISRTARVLVTGSGADNVQKQTGGWTLSWQGDDVTADDLPGATTVAAAVRELVGPLSSTVDPWLEFADVAAHDVALVVIGEDAYAEMCGTIKPWRSMAYADLKPSYARDLQTLRSLHRSGITVVTVLLTGRPLYVTEEINLSDAFVVAWLPGPEGAGVTDVLFAGGDGHVQYDVRGRLASCWPARKDSTAANRIPPHLPHYDVPEGEVLPEGRHTPLFAYGYGLSLRDCEPAGGPAAGLDLDHLPLHELPDSGPPPPAGGPIDVLGPDFRFHLGGHITWSRQEVPLDRITDTFIVRCQPISAGDGRPGLSVRFKGYLSFVYAQAANGRPADLRGYSAGGGRLVMDVRVHVAPNRPLYVACHDDFPAQPGLDITDRLMELPVGEWNRLEIPLADFEGAGMDLRHVDVPFMLYTVSTAHLDLRAVRWVAG